jgi:hypothetical protein
MKSLRVLLSLSLMSLALTVLGGTGCSPKNCSEITLDTDCGKSSLEGGCTWNTDTKKCSKKLNCVVGTQYSDCGNPNLCNSQPALPARCLPKPNLTVGVTCTAPAEGATTCADATNCDFVPKSAASCSPRL